MKYDDIVSMTGVFQGRLMAYIIELWGEEYICKKVLCFGKEDQFAIHSIINSGNSVYLADSYNNKIYSYNYITNILDEVTVGRDPRHMCVDDENMYVSNFESDNISIIDMSSFTLTESIPAGIKPHDVFYNKYNNKLYTCCYEENEIIEYSNNREIRYCFKTIGKPMHMFIWGDYIIVMTYFVNGCIHTKINFINLSSGEIEKVLKIDGLASELDLDYKKNMLYLINIVDKSLYVVNLEKKETVKTVFIGGYPESLSIGENNIYVTNSKKNQIVSIFKEDLSVSNLINLNFTPNCIKVIN